MSDTTTSAASQELKTFFVYAPDGKGEGALDLRYSVRPKHLEGMATLIQDKTISGCSNLALQYTIS